MRHNQRRVLPLVAVVALAAAFAGGAGAAARSADRATSFCSDSKSVAKQLVDAASGLNDSSTIAQRVEVLKSQLALIRSAEPTLRGSVPRALKPRLRTALGFVDLAYTKLSAVNWNVLALEKQPTTVAALEASANRASTSFAALRRYYRKTCGFRV
jgi:hypothetical protein